MEQESATYYREFLIILAVAGVAVPLFLRIGLSSIPSFLIIGVVLGPGILGYLSGFFPWLQNFALADAEALETLGELGVVFLLFLIGLELSFERLKTMRRLVFGLGALQVIVSTVAIAVVAAWLGFSTEQAIVLGMALALSSTAIVVELLSEEKRLGSQTGRVSFAILLFQDIAVVPILLLVGVLGGESSTPIIQDIAVALAQAALAVFIIVAGGRYVLRPLLRMVARANSPDLFTATTLLIALGTGVVANLAGISMSLGAFLAGLMLAETEFRRTIEAIIDPFKGLLLGAFFLLVGLRLDLGGMLENFATIVAIAASLIILKAALVFALARAFRVARGPAIEASLLLGPCGEFGFVVIGAAMASGIFQGNADDEALLVISLTLLLIPVMGKLGSKLNGRLRRARVLAPEAEVAPPEGSKARVIVAGFGRVGQLVGSMLEEHKIAYIAIDNDPDLVARERRAGQKVYFGDAANEAFLRRCGIEDADAIAITMDSPARVDDVTRVARKLRADLKIVARARDERHAMALYKIGVTEAVPETIEASLQLAEALLVETGVAMGLAIAAVHERRDGFRKLLNRPDRREELRLRSRLRRMEKAP